MNPMNFEEIFEKGEVLPPPICVEMSGNHQGRKESAIKFARQAKLNGADFLKVQVYKPDTITIDSNKSDFRINSDNDWASYETLYKLYSKAYTPWDWIKEIFEECTKIDLGIFASPFDHSAVDFLETLKCPAYKIASPEITDISLIEYCASKGKPVIISTGLADKIDLDLAINTINKFDVPYIILKCVSAYPTPIEDMNISTIPWLKDNYKCLVGLSDHSLGCEAAFAATALGSSLIEKHFKLPGDEVSVDSDFSMSLNDLPQFKESIRNIHKSLGKTDLEVAQSAIPSLNGRRSLYISQDIKKGEEFSLKNIKSVRPSYGLHPKFLQDIIGQKSNRNLQKGERMNIDFLDTTN